MRFYKGAAQLAGRLICFYLGMRQLVVPIVEQINSHLDGPGITICRALLDQGHAWAEEAYQQP